MLRGFLGLCKRALGDDCHAHNADQTALEPVEVDLTKVRCPRCRAKGAMVPHSSYSRHFIYRSNNKNHDEIITVIRLMCSSCNTTHAVLPLVAVPYLAYSICFIAALLADWFSGTWLSVEAISAEYSISAKTFLRLKRRFMASVGLAVGKTAAKGRMLAYAAGMAGAGLSVLDGLLSGFFLLAGRSFCEGLPP